ncbi:penicillin acylase family protein [Streptomyces sp. SID3343]|uniref:penicillin acylase family protein n=1 Tax=Streptomyces sp. SID3343 TaxID=2690260 RepID=UPI00136BAEF5|nr:penicillin acylase family protein [Streptomyces sp. SID3343]MYW05262.1 acylase [Streptomyces sp. SID3343]
MSFRPRFGCLALAGIVLSAAAVTGPASAGAGSEARVDRGLSAVVRYTEYGIPHIVADDYPGLGFGNGWAQARDQVCALAEAFVTVRGERSRWFGARTAPDPQSSSAGANLASDLYYRGVREAGTVERLGAAPPPLGPGREVADLGRGWATGYNTWLRRNRITDPACAGAGWVRAITAVDVAALDLALSGLAGEGRGIDGITAARPPVAGEPAPQALDSTAPAAPASAASAVRRLLVDPGRRAGSNAVAFRGSTTANGRGLLLGNPHFPWRGEQRFWQSQQTIPGELDVMGGSLLGSTTVSIGHTAHIAWSHTVGTGVPANLYQLTLDPSDPTVYLVDGRPERMTRRVVTVPVEDGPPVTGTQWWTRYGPVLTSFGAAADPPLPLPWTSETAYAINDAGSANPRGSTTALALAKARDTRGILDAVRRTQGLPWANTVAADSAGHTLYVQSQTLPRITDEIARRCSTALGRTTYPASGLAVLDGARGDCALGTDPDAVQPGTFGPGAMPTLRDAPYVENSNDSAWLTNAEHPLVGYERVFGDIGATRSPRTRGAIEDVSSAAARGGLRVEDLQAQQFANRAPVGDLVADDVARACAALPGGRATGTDGAVVDVAEACRVLGRWDKTVDTGSRGALLFDRFWRRFTAAVPDSERWKVPFAPSDPVVTPHTLDTDSPIFSRALADSVAELDAAGIDAESRWGEHQFVVRDGRRVPIPGGTGNLGVWNVVEADWDPAGGGYPDVSYGTSFVQAVGWDDSACPVARTLLTYSQSSNPRSAHHADQTLLFSRERWVTSRFCEHDILAAPRLRVLTVHEHDHPRGADPADLG